MPVGALRKRCFQKFWNISRNHLCQSFFLINCRPEDMQLYQKETPTQVFSSEYCRIFKNSFLIPLVAACRTWLYLISHQSFLSGFSFIYIHISQDLRGRGRVISLTPYCHFHPFLRYLDINLAITAESSLLHVANSWTRTWNSWFVSTSHQITKVHVLDNHCWQC